MKFEIYVKHEVKHQKHLHVGALAIWSSNSKNFRKNSLQNTCGGTLILMKSQNCLTSELSTEPLHMNDVDSLALSWRRPVSYRNQSIDLLRNWASYYYKYKKTTANQLKPG